MTSFSGLVALICLVLLALLFFLSQGPTQIPLGRQPDRSQVGLITSVGDALQTIQHAAGERR